eukprot:scaffold49520_cov28-Tisochrysis_lutea.AAC.3
MPGKARARLEAREPRRLTNLRCDKRRELVVSNSKASEADEAIGRMVWVAVGVVGEGQVAPVWPVRKAARRSAVDALRNAPELSFGVDLQLPSGGPFRGLIRSPNRQAHRIPSSAYVFTAVVGSGGRGCSAKAMRRLLFG